MKLNEKQKIVLTVMVFVVLLGGLIALNYFKFKDRETLQARIDSLRQEETKANDMIRQIPDLRERRANLANIIDQYASILPLEQHIQHEAFAEVIDNYSRETQVVIQKVEYVEKKKDEKDEEVVEEDQNFIRHRYKLSLVGTFPDFLRFVNKIENHTRFLKVDEIFIKPLGVDRDITKSHKDEGAILDVAKVPFKSIELTLSTYTYKKDSAPVN